jgi:hypothetical protein
VRIQDLEAAFGFFAKPLEEENLIACLDKALTTDGVIAHEQ